MPTSRTACISVFKISIIPIYRIPKRRNIQESIVPTIHRFYGDKDMFTYET